MPLIYPLPKPVQTEAVRVKGRVEKIELRAAPP